MQLISDFPQNIKQRGYKRFKIALIGAYPPPYGGITVHIQRLKYSLEQMGYEVVVYELFRDGKSAERNVIRVKNVRRWLLKYIFTAKEDIIHLQIEAWQVRVIVGLMGFLRRKTVITIHSVTLEDIFKKGGWFRRNLIRFALKQTSFIIAVNPKIRDFLLSLGVKPERTEVIPAFIPPVVKEEDIAEVPREVWDFIKDHSPILLANAFRIYFYHSQDLYGIDMCIDLCVNLKPHYSKIGFVFCLPDIGDEGYVKKMKQRIADKKLEDNFLFQTKPCPMYPIIMKSDVFIRPTVTDGDAVSVREALYFKIPVVASDAVIRPDGVILFKNRDAGSLAGKTENILVDYAHFKKMADHIQTDNACIRILEIYRSIAK